MHKILLFILFSFFSFSQVLDCKVSVNADLVDQTNSQIFETLEMELNEFINKTSWVNRRGILQRDKLLVINYRMWLGPSLTKYWLTQVQLASDQPKDPNLHGCSTTRPHFQQTLNKLVCSTLWITTMEQQMPSWFSLMRTQS